jgi:hypothetical protein
MRPLFLACLGFWAAWVFSVDARAFPNAIGHGYTSCLNCHFNPMGGGPLTDYGRAIGATAFAAVPFFVSAQGRSPEEVDERLGQTSGFLGAIRLPEWIRPGANYRGLYLRQNLTSADPLSRWITMLAEGNLVLRTKKERFLAVGRLAYIPVPETIPAAQKNAARNLISREHYVGSRITRSLGLYLGMMDTAFGIRVPDHTAYLRSMTLLNQADQSHTLMIHYGAKSMDAAVQLLAGNLYQSTDLRMQGASGIFEVDLGKDSRWGLSAYAASNDYRSRWMGAAHGRVGFFGNAALLGQVGLIGETPVGQTSRRGGYFFGQYSAPLVRGFNTLMTTEFYTADLNRDVERRFRAGPSIQYLPMQRLELRVDLLGTRSTGAARLQPDSFTLQSQVHVWL